MFVRKPQTIESGKGQRFLRLLGQRPMQWVLSHKSDEFDEVRKQRLNAQVFQYAPPISASDYPARCLALLSVSVELRSMEEMVAEHGVEVSSKTVSQSVLNFDWRLLPISARSAAAVRNTASGRSLCSHGDKRADLWRAADDEGKVPEILIQSR